MVNSTKRNQTPVSKHFYEETRRHAKELSKLGIAQKLAYCRQRIIGIARQKKILTRLVSRLYLTLGLPIPIAFRYILSIRRHVISQYHPQAYSGKLVLLKCMDQRFHDYYKSWQKFAVNGIELHEIPGKQ